MSKHDIKVFAGEKSLEQIVEMDSIDMVLNALVGYAGLLPTYNALQHKKSIALANKETLVVAGEIITRLAPTIKRLSSLSIPSIPLFFNV